MKSRIVFCAMCGLLVFALAAGGVWAVEGYKIESYSETYSPGENADGVLKVLLKAAPADDGYVYLFKSFAKMTPRGNLEASQNTEGGLEAYKTGDIEFFRVKAADPGSPVSLTASFDCPGFYGAKAKVNGETGSPAIPVNTKFANPFSSAIGAYNVKVILPAGQEIVNVTAPKAYADYTLGREADNARSVSVSKKKLAPMAALNLTCAYGKTAANSAAGTFCIWAICLAVGIAVLIARLPKKKTQSA